MYCPRCRAEYRPGFLRCHACECDLVEVLPAEDLTTPEAMARLLSEREVEVVAAGNHVELQRIQSRLASAGVATAIGREDAETVVGVHPRFVLVAAVEDLAKARGVLEAAWREEAGRLEELTAVEAVSSDRCPACGAEVGEDRVECPDCGLFLGGSA